jgi:succinate dehydrogenase/fumarate reductase flavoprotein subunit
MMGGGTLWPRRFWRNLKRCFSVTGGVHGTNRLGGNATTDCIVNGRACGKNAAAEKSWV